METWRRKLSVLGLNTQQMMGANGTKKLVRQWEQIFRDAVCMQFLPRRIFTKWVESRWQKSLIKFKMKAKTCSLWNWVTKRWRFQRKIWWNLQSESRKQLSIGLKICFSRFPWFLTSKHLLVSSFIKESWNFCTLRHTIKAKVANLSLAGEASNIKTTRKKC